MNQISLRGLAICTPAAQEILETAPPELKPCPFCRNALNFTLVTSDTQSLHIECLKCGARGPGIDAASVGIYSRWKEAGRAWNNYPATRLQPLH